MVNKTFQHSPMIAYSNPSTIIKEEKTNIGKLPKYQVGIMSTNENQKLKCVGQLGRHCCYDKLGTV